MIFQIKTYLQFLIRSSNQHGVHSPFVYDLVTQCFYDRKKYSEYTALKRYRKSLLNNTNSISVTDFGAGSKVFKSNERQVAAIAKNAGISPKRAALLFRITGYFKPNHILEIGTSLGLATSALHLGNPEAKLMTVEGCPATLAVSKQQFQHNESNLHNIKFVNAEFSEFLKSPEVLAQKFDLICFDGNHSKEATLNYFNLLLPTITNDTVWIFDDIYWNQGMAEAWQKIKTHKSVTISIDTYGWGLVFFRKEQEKEHFVIRV